MAPSPSNCTHLPTQMWSGKAACLKSIQSIAFALHRHPLSSNKRSKLRIHALAICYPMSGIGGCLVLRPGKNGFKCKSEFKILI